MPDKLTILITGCSTGIGRASAERLARAGHTVYASARRLDDVADLESAGCRPLVLDVTDEASMEAAVSRVDEEAGGVEALVNNAGYSQSGAVETLEMDALRRQFETNVFGLVRLTQLVLPGMRARGFGRIVNISSMGANFTFPGGGAYHATKYAVEALSDALRYEVEGFGIDVVVVQPGAIRTEFDKAAVASLERASGADDVYGEFNRKVGQATKEAYEKGPLKLLGGEPDDVAKVIERALTAKRPRTRYHVTPSAKIMIGQSHLMTDRIWDRFNATQFPKPGRS
ncbi:MAG: SDR family NAD(P)-dependent oxidoreductase [Solirubrobacterales bacterium]|nr:SDR family NAD(P)-dependent oxidoreductase [Solirubrobacterales bacterium]